MAIEEVSSARLAAETRPAGLLVQQGGSALGIAPHYESAAASAKATMAAAGGILLLVSGEGLLAHTSGGGAGEAAPSKEPSSRGGALPPPPVHTSLPHHVEAELSAAWRRLAVLLGGLSAAPGTAVPLTVFVVLPGMPSPSVTLPPSTATSAPAATGSYAAALRTSSSSPKGAAGASRTVVATASVPSAVGSEISAAEAATVEAARAHLSAAAAAWPEALRKRVKGLRILPLLPHRRPEVGRGGGEGTPFVQREGMCLTWRKPGRPRSTPRGCLVLHGSMGDITI